MGPTSPSSTRVGTRTAGSIRRTTEDYVGTRLRSPKEPLIVIPHTLSEETGPVFGDREIGELDHDLAAARGRAARRADHRQRPCPGLQTPSHCEGQLVEIWQANAAGRYAHSVDDHDAPLDPNFSGGGRCLTGDDGEYRFITIKPGAYPWPNHPNAWRPEPHPLLALRPGVHGAARDADVLPGDPLFEFDPIFNSIRDEQARERLVSRFDLELTKPDWALGYRFDIVVGGRDSTPFEEPHVD